MTPVAVTVAVPTKDRKERMLRCLRALLAQDHPSYEILVLDNGSTDGTPEACRDLAADSATPVRVVVLEGSVGAVRNAGARLAAGEVVAFTDSDCLPDPGWLAAIEAPLLEDPAVGVVCGVTRPEEPFSDGWPATMDVDHFTGRFDSCNIAFRARALRECDGFDEEIGHFWEDVAAGYAMRRAGWRSAFAPTAIVLHDVTYPGFAWHVRRALKQANLGPVLARYPEIADDLLWRRVFLSPRDAKLCAALLGVALAPRVRPAAVLAAPYVMERLPASSWRDPKAIAQAVVYDAATVVGALRAGVRARRLVL